MAWRASRLSLALLLVLYTSARACASSASSKSAYAAAACQERGASDACKDKWRHKYFEEPADGFQVRVVEDSLDERLANIAHTVASERRHMDILSFASFSSGNSKQDAINMDLVAGPQVSDAQCGRHLRQMLSLLDEINAKLVAKRANSSSTLKLDERHLRVARVLDSYGRYESGHLSGRTHSPGQYDQCTSTDLMLDDDDGGVRKVGAGYCWARMDLSKHLDRALKIEFATKDTPLMLGICLPRSCHTKTFAKNRDLIQRLVDSQFKLPRELYIDETLRVDSIFCLVDSESAHASLPLSGKLALTFLASWLALALYATFFAHSHEPLRGSPAKVSSDKQLSRCGAMIDCLNLRESWHDFLGRPDDALARRNRKVDLDALNPLKGLGCAFIVLGHSLIFQAFTVQDTLRTTGRIENDPLTLTILLGTAIVDSFFVLTGILMGYLVMRRASRLGQTKRTEVTGNDRTGGAQAKRPGEATQFFGQWLQFAVARYLRLVPLYFLVFWFKKSVLIGYFAGWPLWDAGYNKNTYYGACRLESWATPFTLMAAFTPLSRQCLGQAWSVANDLFFSLALAPILLVMPSRPKLALLVSLVIIAMSNYAARSAYAAADPALTEALADFRTLGLGSTFDDLHHLNTYPQYRVSSILIGMMAGYFLGLYGKQSDELKEWPRWFRSWATRMSLGVIVLTVLVFANMPTVRYCLAPHHRSVTSTLFSTGRTTWALCNAVLFMRIASDWRKSSFAQIFSGSFWRASARLNYAILLIHMDLLIYFIASDTTLGYYSRRGFLVHFGHTYFYCIPLAMLLHLVYENPIDKLTRGFVTPKLSVSS